MDERLQEPRTLRKKERVDPSCVDPSCDLSGETGGLRPSQGERGGVEAQVSTRHSPHPAFPGVLGDGNWVAEIWVYYKLFFISDFKYLEPLLTRSNRDSSLIPTPNPGPSQEELLCPALG